MLKLHGGAHLGAARDDMLLDSGLLPDFLELEYLREQTLIRFAQLFNIFAVPIILFTKGLFCFAINEQMLILAAQFLVD